MPPDSPVLHRTRSSTRGGFAPTPAAPSPRAPRGSAAASSRRCITARSNASSRPLTSRSCQAGAARISPSDRALPERPPPARSAPRGRAHRTSTTTPARPEALHQERPGPPDVLQERVELHPCSSLREVAVRPPAGRPRLERLARRRGQPPPTPLDCPPQQRIGSAASPSGVARVQRPLQGIGLHRGDPRPPDLVDRGVPGDPQGEPEERVRPPVRLGSAAPPARPGAAPPGAPPRCPPPRRTTGGSAGPGSSAPASQAPKARSSPATIDGRWTSRSIRRRPGAARRSRSGPARAPVHPRTSRPTCPARAPAPGGPEHRRRPIGSRRRRSPSGPTGPSRADRRRRTQTHDPAVRERHDPRPSVRTAWPATSAFRGASDFPCYASGAPTPAPARAIGGRTDSSALAFFRSTIRALAGCADHRRSTGAGGGIGKGARARRRTQTDALRAHPVRQEVRHRLRRVGSPGSTVTSSVAATHEVSRVAIRCSQPERLDRRIDVPARPPARPPGPRPPPARTGSRHPPTLAGGDRRDRQLVRHRAGRGPRRDHQRPARRIQAHRHPGRCAGQEIRDRRRRDLPHRGPGDHHVDPQRIPGPGQQRPDRGPDRLVRARRSPRGHRRRPAPPRRSGSGRPRSPSRRCGSATRAAMPGGIRRSPRSRSRCTRR